MRKILSVILLGVLVVLLWLSYQPTQDIVEPKQQNESVATAPEEKDDFFDDLEPHICHEVFPTPPEPLRAIYMTSWVAGTPSIRANLVQKVKDTDLNALVIDIKDATGYVSGPFEFSDFPELAPDSNRITDLPEFITSLCEAGIYPIARIVVFKDPLYVDAYPEQAVQYVDGTLWRDGGRDLWVSPAARRHYDYTISLAQQAYQLGFPEINLDYIRYPATGKISEAVFPYQRDRTRRQVMEQFFRQLDSDLRLNGIVLSADIFGMVVTATDDVGIGQYLEDVAKYFDAVAPMVYPSHYPAGFAGISNPNAYPYATVYQSMRDGVRRLGTTTSSAIFRPWLQDFGLAGMYYGHQEVQDQIRALYDLGIESFMLWDPQNTYHY